MAEYSNRYSLILPNKPAGNEEATFRQNWLNLERFANRSGLPSHLSPKDPLSIYTTDNPATDGVYPTVVDPTATLLNPLEAKIFIQAETLIREPNAGGDTIVTFPVVFPNGVISIVITNGGSGFAAQRATFTLFPDYTDRSRFTFHTHNEATGANWSGQLRFCYIALGY